MTGVASWRLALRIARREARRAKGRSALVVALIGLPMLGLSFAAVNYDMFTLTIEEKLSRELGTADARLTWVGGGPIIQQDLTGMWWEPLETAGGDQEGATGDVEDEEESGRGAVPSAQELAALLPPGTEVSPRWQGATRLKTATGVGWLSIAAFDLDDPLGAGIAALVDGRAPAAGEAAVTAQAAERLGVQIGDELEVADTGERYPVVGEFEFPAELGEYVLFHPDAMPGGDEDRWPTWLISTREPVSWEQVREINTHGFTVYSRAVALDPPAEVAEAEFDAGRQVDGEEFGTGALIGGLAVLEIVLLAGPAFAVGARQRRRELGLIAAGGGTPAQLRRIVLADGVVLGFLGAAAGILLGVIAAFVARPLVEEWLVNARAGGYRVFPLALVGIVVIAVGTGVLAALVPAFTAARQQVVAALSGRRGVTGARRRWLVLGLAMIGLGAAVTAFGAWRVSTTLVLAGLVIGQLGLVLCTPSIVGLVARVGSRLPLAPRIALRDTARNRSSAAPAISAVLAAVAGATAAGVVLISFYGEDSGYYYSFPPGAAIAGGAWEWAEFETEEQPLRGTVEDVKRVAQATLPVAEIYQISRLDCGPDHEYGCQVQVRLPAEARCPFWDAPPPLTRAEQREARQDPRCHSSHGDMVMVDVVDDGSAAPGILGADHPDLAAATRLLQDGGMLVSDPRYLTDGGTVAAELVGYQESGDTIVAEAGALPAMAISDAGEWGVIASPAALAQLGAQVRDSQLLISTTREPSQAEEDAFAAALEEYDSYGYVMREYSDDVAPMLVVLAAAAGLVALGAAGIATGLAAADRRPDLSTLAAVGATPRVRRALSLSQSGVIAGLGTVLGLVAGLGAAIAVLVALNQRYANTWPGPDPVPVQVPWLQLVVLLAVPVVAMLGAGLLTRSRLPIEQRFG